jgi:hypothetical protein
MPQRPTREHGVNPTLVMPFGKKLHSLHRAQNQEVSLLGQLTQLDWDQFRW